MREAKSIKITTLHLDGDAQEWWYHILIIVGHITITSYTKFTRRFIECFDKDSIEFSGIGASEVDRKHRGLHGKVSKIGSDGY